MVTKKNQSRSYLNHPVCTWRRHWSIQYFFFLRARSLKLLEMVVQIRCGARFRTWESDPKNSCLSFMLNMHSFLRIFLAVPFGNSFDLWILILPVLHVHVSWWFPSLPFHVSLVSKVHYCFTLVWDHWGLLLFVFKFTPLRSCSSGKIRGFKARVFSVVFKGQH
jgi:hypothetical protein